MLLQIILLTLLGACIDCLRVHINNKKGVEILSELLLNEFKDVKAKDVKSVVNDLYFKFLSMYFVKSCFIYIIPSVVIVYLIYLI